MATKQSIVPTERIEKSILLIRDQKVLLDKDLATLYGVETKVLNQAVTRNLKRFPDDFMFRLTRQELRNLKSQFVTSSWGGTRKLPRAFAEQGVAMLSSVLKSERAIQVNVEIMRSFGCVGCWPVMSNWHANLPPSKRDTMRNSRSSSTLSAS